MSNSHQWLRGHGKIWISDTLRFFLAHVKTWAQLAQTRMGFVILTTQPHRCLDSLAFAEAFGVIAQARTEDWGELVLQRIWYQDGFEVKFGITQSDWAAQPWDAGTRKSFATARQFCLTAPARYSG